MTIINIFEIFDSLNDFVCSAVGIEANLWRDSQKEGDGTKLDTLWTDRKL